MSFITDVTIKNIGAAQVNVPFTFGQVFAVGDLKAGEVVTGKLANGTDVSLQCDVKASHADDSVRHMIISGVLVKANADEAVTLQLVKATAQAAPAPAQAPQTAASVVLTIGADKYSASLADATKSLTWLAGGIANESIYDAPLKNAQGVAHERLTVRFGVRTYVSGQARVEVIVENMKTWVAASNETYDVDVTVNGRIVYSKAGLTHYHHARWRNVSWTGMKELVVHLSTPYLISTKAISNYDQTQVASESTLAEFAKALPGITGPMKIGPLLAYMPNTGGRGDIGPLPQWTVIYLLSLDTRARAVVDSIAEGSGSWSIHYRDEKTGLPIRTDNDANKNISLHWNLRNDGPLPVPRCLNGDESLCTTPFIDDTAHQPSIAYVPYLITGDHYYLEELHFWAATNPLATAPSYSGNGKGLLRWQQMRGQGWSMRTLGHAVYITPDSHPLKAYFTKQLNDNLGFYHETYVVGNPNQLGVYDGSGQYSFEVGNSAPWQDDFLTWSFGYLAELGFFKAKPMFDWKAKYPIGRMTGPGYCFTEAAAYGLQFKDSKGVKIETFAELYTANFPNENITDDNGKVLTHPKGLLYRDMPCGSQEQADWRAVAGNTAWSKGRMTGYADSAIGYPADMQPALALSASAGVVNGALAWKTYEARADHPNFGNAPQFNIIPRSLVTVVAQPVVTAPVEGVWSRVGVENDTITVPANTTLRYGGSGKFITKTVSGTFVATNVFFGGDPTPNNVKVVEQYTPTKITPPPVVLPAPPTQPSVQVIGKIVSPSSTKLLKATHLTVCLFDAETLAVVKTFEDVAASSKGVITLTDKLIVKGVQYAATVADTDGQVVLVHFPLSGT